MPEGVGRKGHGHGRQPAPCANGGVWEAIQGPAAGLMEDLYANYDRLSEEIRLELPLKRVWMVTAE